MRCYPLALLPDNTLIYRDIYLSNPSSVVEEIEKDYITCLRMALNDESAEDILNFFLRKKKNRSTQYQNVIDDIQNGEKRTLTNKKSKGVITEGKGSIMSSIYSVIWCLFYYVNGYKIDDKKKKVKKNISIFNLYETLIVDFPGSDTDTNCAIMGGLFGCIIGYKTMAEDEDFEYNMSLIYDIEQETDRPRPYEYHPSYMLELYPKIIEMYESYNFDE